MGKAFSIEDRSLRDLARMNQIIGSLDREVAKDLRRRMKREVTEPLAQKVKAKAPAPQDRLAARSVRARGGNKPSIAGGVGKGPAAAVFFGSEFGGGNRKTRYVAKGRGWRKLVTRRTTRQFRKHKGIEGYWFSPTIVDAFEPTARKLFEIASDAIAREL